MKRNIKRAEIIKKDFLPDFEERKKMESHRQEKYQLENGGNQSGFLSMQAHGFGNNVNFSGGLRPGNEGRNMPQNSIKNQNQQGLNHLNSQGKGFGLQQGQQMPQNRHFGQFGQIQNFGVNQQNLGFGGQNQHQNAQLGRQGYTAEPGGLSGGQKPPFFSNQGVQPEGGNVPFGGVQRAPYHQLVNNQAQETGFGDDRANSGVINNPLAEIQNMMMRPPMSQLNLANQFQGPPAPQYYPQGPQNTQKMAQNHPKMPLNQTPQFGQNQPRSAPQPVVDSSRVDPMTIESMLPQFIHLLNSQLDSSLGPEILIRETVRQMLMTTCPDLPEEKAGELVKKAMNTQKVKNQFPKNSENQMQNTTFEQPRGIETGPRAHQRPKREGREPNEPLFMAAPWEEKGQERVRLNDFLMEESEQNPGMELIERLGGAEMPVLASSGPLEVEKTQKTENQRITENRENQRFGNQMEVREDRYPSIEHRLTNKEYDYHPNPEGRALWPQPSLKVKNQAESLKKKSKKKKKKRNTDTETDQKSQNPSMEKNQYKENFSYQEMLERSLEVKRVQKMIKETMSSAKYMPQYTEWVDDDMFIFEVITGLQSLLLLERELHRLQMAKIRAKKVPGGEVGHGEEFGFEEMVEDLGLSFEDTAREIEEATEKKKAKSVWVSGLLVKKSFDYREEINKIILNERLERNPEPQEKGFRDNKTNQNDQSDPKSQKNEKFEKSEFLEEITRAFDEENDKLKITVQKNKHYLRSTSTGFTLDTRSQNLDIEGLLGVPLPELVDMLKEQECCQYMQISLQKFTKKQLYRFARKIFSSLKELSHSKEGKSIVYKCLAVDFSILTNLFKHARVLPNGEIIALTKGRYPSLEDRFFDFKREQLRQKFILEFEEEVRGVGDNPDLNRVVQKLLKEEIYLIRVAEVTRLQSYPLFSSKELRDMSRFKRVDISKIEGSGVPLMMDFEKNRYFLDFGGRELPSGEGVKYEKIFLEESRGDGETGFRAKGVRGKRGGDDFWGPSDYERRGREQYEGEGYTGNNDDYTSNEGSMYGFPVSRQQQPNPSAGKNQKNHPKMKKLKSSNSSLADSNNHSIEITALKKATILPKKSKLLSIFFEIMNQKFIDLRQSMHFTKTILTALEYTTLYIWPEFSLPVPESFLNRAQELNSQWLFNFNKLIKFALQDPVRHLGTKDYLNKCLVMILSQMDNRDLIPLFFRLHDCIPGIIYCKYGNFLVQEIIKRVGAWRSGLIQENELYGRDLNRLGLFFEGLVPGDWRGETLTKKDKVCVVGKAIIFSIQTGLLEDIQKTVSQKYSKFVLCWLFGNKRPKERYVLKGVDQRVLSERFGTQSWFVEEMGKKVLELSLNT